MTLTIFDKADSSARDMKKEKTQTTPKGYAIPIPNRGDVFRDLKKAATPQKSGKRPRTRLSSLAGA